MPRKPWTCPNMTEKLLTAHDVKVYEPHHEKTSNVVFEQFGHKQELYKHRRWLEAGNFGFRKYRNCTIRIFFS